MVDRLREARPRVLRLAWRPLTASALVVGACSGEGSPPSLIPPSATGASGAASVSGATGAASAPGVAGALGTGGSGIVVPPLVGPATCAPTPAGTRVFGDQIVRGAPFPLELYSWTTDAQVSEIRAGGVLLTRSEREGLGPGFAFELLKQLASTGSGEQEQLAKLLTSAAFAKGRYAWPHPWATRLGWPGESYGNRLLRIVLRQDAWLAVFRRGRLSAIDSSNMGVSVADVLSHPERLAGLFFHKDAEVGGPSCGTFSAGGNGYREFIVCNETMIAEWSLGTDTIRERVQTDIARLETFLTRIRSCPERRDAGTWNLSVGCAWQAGFASDSEQGAYEGALAMPSLNYLPAPMQLATLIGTLQGDPPELEPLVVEPGK